jgi:hypothetical protein
MDTATHMDFSTRRQLNAASEAPRPLPRDPSATLMYDHMRFDIEACAAIYRIGDDLRDALRSLVQRRTDRTTVVSAIRDATTKCRRETGRIAAAARVHAARRGTGLGLSTLVALADLQFAGLSLEAVANDELGEIAGLLTSAEDIASSMRLRDQATSVALHMKHPVLLDGFDIATA